MSQPPPYGYPPQQPYGYQEPPSHPQAITVLILGILGIVLCQICAPFAWVMGRKALREIDNSGGAIGGRTTVQIGYILGIIGTVLIVLAIVIFIVVFIIAIAVGSTSS